MRFRLTGGRRVTQFDFLEVAATLRSRQSRHLGAGGFGRAERNRPVKRIVFRNRFAVFRHVATLDVAQDRFGGFLAGRDGSDGHPRTALHVTTGEDAFPAGGIGYGVHFRGAPAREVNAGHVFEGRKVRLLTDGRHQLVDFDVILAARNEGPDACVRRNRHR